MKLDLKTILIAGLTIVVIILIMRNCSRRSEEREADRRTQYETEVAILKAEKTSIQKAQDSIGKVLVRRTRKDSLAIKRQESVIQALERKAVSQRTPLVETLIVDNPELLTFVTTQQEVITELKVKIDTLKAQKEFHAKVSQDLIVQEFLEDKITQQMAIEYEVRISELEKQVKKRKKGGKFWRGAATVLAGAVLVETVLLVAD